MSQNNIYMDLKFAPEKCSLTELQEAALQMLKPYVASLYRNDVNKRSSRRKKKSTDAVLQIPKPVQDELRNLVETISNGYANLPYHNFAHAVDVTQLMFTLLTGSKFNLDYSDREKFYLLFACLCHDIGHFGVGNEFLTRKFSGCTFCKHHARSFEHAENRTIMEQFHAEKALEILDTSIFFRNAGFDPVVKTELKVWMCNLILATDLGNQKFFLEKISNEGFNCFAEDNTLKGVVPPSNLSLLLIKLCDLGNVFRSYKSARKWTEFVLEENEARNAVISKYQLQQASEFWKACNQNKAATQILKNLGPKAPTFNDFKEICKEIDPKLSIVEEFCKNPKIRVLIEIIKANPKAKETLEVLQGKERSMEEILETATKTIDEGKKSRRVYADKFIHERMEGFLSLIVEQNLLRFKDIFKSQVEIYIFLCEGLIEGLKPMGSDLVARYSKWIEDVRSDM